MKSYVFDRRAMAASLVALAVILLAFIGAFAWLQLRMMDLHDREVYANLERELALRGEFDRSMGRARLLEGMAWRTVTPEPGRQIVIVDADGEDAFGTIADLPGGARVLDQPTRRLSLPLDDGGYAFVLAFRLDDGSYIIKSITDYDRGTIVAALGRTALAIIFMVTLIGIATLLLLNRYVLDHVRNLAETASRIMRGQVTARASSPQRLDALGTLTSTFNNMLDQNEALVTGLRTVTESLAHDLRSPLVRVHRAITAARNTDEPEKHDTHLADAEANAARAVQTFNALVDLARAEAGLSRDSMEQVNLGSVVTDLIELYGPLAEEKGQHIDRQIGSVQVVGHRQILTQAVGNLLENAIKYSPSGSALRVSVSPSHGDELPEILVEDRGPGIAEHDREQAMRPFVRLESSRREPGAGMGLAIAAAVARLHRGRLLLENAEPGLRVRLQFGVT
jgi:signal transduction histidine kinase